MSYEDMAPGRYTVLLNSQKIGQIRLTGMPAIDNGKLMSLILKHGIKQGDVLEYVPMKKESNSNE